MRTLFCILVQVALLGIGGCATPCNERPKNIRNEPVTVDLEPLKVFQNFWEACFRLDIGAVAALLAPDPRWGPVDAIRLITGGKTVDAVGDRTQIVFAAKSLTLAGRDHVVLQGDVLAESIADSAMTSELISDGLEFDLVRFNGRWVVFLAGHGREPSEGQ